MTDPIKGALVEALQDCLRSMGWSNYSDDELQREHDLGNGTAQVILRARAIIEAAKRQ